MAKEFYELGDFLTGMYPRHNHEGYRTGKQIRRTFQLTEIRDLNVCPLEAQTLAATPTICRSDILLTGVDCDSGETRSFYLGSFTELRKIEPGEIKGKAVRVFIFDKAGGLAGREVFADTDREAFCEFFNARSPNCIAIPE